MFERVLDDGSTQSQAALAAARTLAERAGGTVEALVAVELPMMLTPGPWDEVVDSLVDEAKQRLASLGGVKATALWCDAGQALRLLSDRVDLLPGRLSSLRPGRAHDLGHHVGVRPAPRSLPDGRASRARCAGPCVGRPARAGRRVGQMTGAQGAERSRRSTRRT